MMKVW